MDKILIFNNKLYLTSLFLISIVLGLLYFYFSPNSMLEQGDASGYDKIGWNIAQGYGFSDDGISPSAMRAPIYPYFLGLVYNFEGQSYCSIRIIQILLNSLCVLLVYFIGKDVFSKRVGNISALIYAIYPGFIMFTGFLMTEILSTFFLLSAIAIIIKSLRKKSILLAGGGGILLGLSTLTKPSTLFFPIFLITISLMRKEYRSYIKYYTVLLIIMIITVIPWTIRNYVTFDKLIPVSIFTGYNFYLGSFHPDDKSSFSLEEFKADYWEDPIEKDKFYLNKSIERIFSAPADFISYMPLKLIYFYLPFGLAVIGSSTSAIAITLIFSQFILLFFALLGIYRCGFTKQSVLLINLILYFTIIHLIIISVPRFNIPIMPFLIIFNAHGMLFLYQKIRNKILLKYSF